MSARNFVPMAPASFPDDANLVDATNRQPLLSDPPQRRAPQQLGTEPATKLPVPSSPIAPVPHRRATSPVSPTSGTGLPLSSDARTLNAVISQLQAVWTDLPNEIAQNGTYRIDGWRDAAVDILESLIRVDAIMRSFMNVRLLERTDKGDRCAVRYRRHVGKLRGELKVLEKLPALQPASGILRLDLPILQRKARNIYNLERKITSDVYTFVAHHFWQMEHQKRVEQRALKVAWTQEEERFFREKKAMQEEYDRLKGLQASLGSYIETI